MTEPIRKQGDDYIIDGTKVSPPSYWNWGILIGGIVATALFATFAAYQGYPLTNFNPTGANIYLASKLLVAAMAAGGVVGRIINGDQYQEAAQLYDQQQSQTIPTPVLLKTLAMQRGPYINSVESQLSQQLEDRLNQGDKSFIQRAEQVLLQQSQPKTPGI
jgi:hypothetical protein